MALQRHIFRQFRTREDAEEWAELARSKGFGVSVFEWWSTSMRKFVWKADVYASGEDARERLRAAFQTPTREGRSKYDWSRADWSKSDTEIAKNLGCGRAHVWQQRRKMKQ